MANPNILITAGCSFSTSDGESITWPIHLEKMLKPKIKLHLGQGALGNGMISRRVIHAVTEQLKTHDSKELLVGIMWSSFNRLELYNKNTIPHHSVNHGPTHHNPLKVAGKKNFYLINCHYEDDTSSLYYKNFYNETYATILTLEHILRVQWFLKSHNIKYFMTLYMQSALPIGLNKYESGILNDPDVRYLYDLIDKSNWLSIEGMIEYVETKKFTDIRYANHPSTEEHRYFTESMIIPHLKSVGYIE
jgi:hypothetical protein